MPTLADELRARPDAHLARLLAARPDLAVPPPSSVTALATRAGTRTSVDRALADLTTFELQVAEALVALANAGGRAVAVPRAAVAAGLGTDPEPAIDRLILLALVLADAEGLTPVPALSEAFGTYPAGLGPGLSVLDTMHPAEAAPSSPLTPADLHAVLADAPEGARRVLDALTWGPPVGTVDPRNPGPGARWLAEHGVLRHLSPTQLVLPREVALAAREGRLIRRPAPSPPEVDAPIRSGDVMGSESGVAADRLVRNVSAVLAAWDEAAPAIVRAGGLAVREIRRLSARLEASTEETTFAAEIAAMAGLVAPWSGGESPTWLPTDDSDRWLALDLSSRWSLLAGAWGTSSRASWLAGTRDDRDAPRTVLGDGLERGGVPRLRRRVLTAMAGLPRGAAPTPEQVHALLTWTTPRSTPALATVEAVLREAGWLGLTGAGALAEAGRALLAGAREGDLAAALEADLPPLVGDLVVQADLTALVPGRPEPDLEDLLEACAQVETRGSALTVRFTPSSVARAFDRGRTGEYLLTGLRRHARTDLPQPLEYLIADQARRHGTIRVGAAGTYLRSDDVAALATVVADPHLAYLRLRSLAPTVLVSPEPAAVVAEGLRGVGASAVLEAPDGSVLDVRSRASRVRAGPRRRLGGMAVGVSEPSTEDLDEVVAVMRDGDERAAAEGLRAVSGAAPARSLAMLRDAAEASGVVVLSIAGAQGAVERRVVRPLSVEAGRVRVVDIARLAELTVAVHRIVDVEPWDGTGGALPPPR